MKKIFALFLCLFFCYYCSYCQWGNPGSVLSAISYIPRCDSTESGPISFFSTSVLRSKNPTVYDLQNYDADGGIYVPTGKVTLGFCSANGCPSDTIINNITIQNGIEVDSHIYKNDGVLVSDRSLFGNAKTLTFDFDNGVNLFKTEWLQNIYKREIGVGSIATNVFHRNNVYQIFSQDATRSDFNLIYTSPDYSMLRNVNAGEGGESMIRTDTNAVKLVITGARDLEINGDPGDIYKYLFSFGDNSPPAWKHLQMRLWDNQTRPVVPDDTGEFGWNMETGTIDIYDTNSWNSIGGRDTTLASMLQTNYTLRNINKLEVANNDFENSLMKILLIGDSNIDAYWRLQQGIQEAYSTHCEIAGPGWVDFASQSSPPVGISPVSLTGSWSSNDIGQGQSIAGYIVSSSTAGDEINFSSQDVAVEQLGFFTSIKIYYLNTGGTFSYEIDGGTPVNVVMDNSGTLGVELVSGLDDQIHSVKIANVSGQTDLLGAELIRDINGAVVVSKAGNSGTQVSDFLAMDSTIFAAQLIEHNPELIYCGWGTNEWVADVDVQTYRASLTQFIGRIKAALPDVTIVVGSPPSSTQSTSNVTPLSDYVIKTAEVCEETNISHLNWYSYFPNWAQLNTNGYATDDIHFSANGGRVRGEIFVDIFNLRNLQGTGTHGYLSTTLAKKDDNITYIANPIGATISTAVNTTGAIEIKLPPNTSGAMLKGVLDLFLFDEGQSLSIELGAFAHTTFREGTATIRSKNSAHDYTVRLNRDAGDYYIYIGETTTSWPILKGIFRDVQIGHTNFSVKKWKDDWDINIVSSFKGTTDATLTDNLIGKDSSIGKTAVITNTNTNQDLNDGTGWVTITLDSIEYNELGLTIDSTGFTIDEAGTYRLTGTASVQSSATRIATHYSVSPSKVALFTTYIRQVNGIDSWTGTGSITLQANAGDKFSFECIREGSVAGGLFAEAPKALRFEITRLR